MSIQLQSLSISDTSIHQDNEGRFSLNDLHKAAGSEKKHIPSYWLKNQQTKELISELETTGIPVVSLEGRKGGTYVVKELVYAYAMWISPKFHLQVIRAYDVLHTQSTPELARLTQENDFLQREYQRIRQALTDTLVIELGQPGVERVMLKFKCSAPNSAKWALTLSDGLFTARPMDNDEFVTSAQRLPKHLAEPGFISRQHLPSIIKAAVSRLE
ncbi:MAG: KilA-N domain-containing protein [Magnetococcus sp. YQC-3]